MPLLYSTLRPPAKELNTALGILISRKPEELEQTDEATLYLASLAGLPGTENVDLDRARAHFEDLAQMVKKQTEATSKYQHSIGKDFKDNDLSKMADLGMATQINLPYQAPVPASLNQFNPVVGPPAPSK
ncbi:MAG: hypothetical protein LV479_07850 [Methylacidiphilales bacterium]|nr:hypothetical protein [Candidatus Methylacidiphilales bacterium]